MTQVNPDERKRKAPKKKAKAEVEAEEDVNEDANHHRQQEVPEGAEIVYEGWNASADKEKSQLFIDQLLASLQALLDIGDMIPGWVDKERQLIVNKFALQLGQFSDPGIVTRFGEKRMAEFNKTAEDLKVSFEFCVMFVGFLFEILLLFSSELPVFIERRQHPCVCHSQGKEGKVARA